jgi:penicillin amidase
MLALQLDTTTEFYAYYHRVALAALDRRAEGSDTFQDALRDHLAAWDGKAEPGSLGLAVLVEFQNKLLEAVFAPVLERCRSVDAQFGWRLYDDTPLRQILEARSLELLPKGEGYIDWDDFIVKMTKDSARRLMALLGVGALNDLSWGNVNVVAVRHPLSGALPWLGNWIDMPAAAHAGCLQCVRLSWHEWGVTNRLVVSPGHEQDAIFEMPTGQSGHPMSASYSNQHEDWVVGSPQPFLPERAEHMLVLAPARLSDKN